MLKAILAFPTNWTLYNTHSIELGSHRGGKFHHPTSSLEINVVGTITGSLSNLHCRRRVSDEYQKVLIFIAQLRALSFMSEKMKRLSIFLFTSFILGIKIQFKKHYKWNNILLCFQNCCKIQN